MARFVAALAIEVEVLLDRFPQLRPDREHRVQARHRVLEDHRDLLAPDTAPGAFRQPEQIPPLELDAPGGDPRGARQDPHRREGGDALAAPGLADETERLPGTHVERDPVDRVHDARGSSRSGPGDPRP